MRAQLVPLDGGSPIEIVKDLIVVGRKEDCDLRLEHKSVSKMHCVLVKTDGLLLLRNLGSTNGTRVNGTRVRRAALLPNDQLSIAHYKFRVFLGPDAPAEVHAEEYTQHLNSFEVADLLRQARVVPRRTTIATTWRSRPRAVNCSSAISCPMSTPTTPPVRAEIKSALDAAHRDAVRLDGLRLGQYQAQHAMFKRASTLSASTGTGSVSTR